MKIWKAYYFFTIVTPIIIFAGVVYLYVKFLERTWEIYKKILDAIGRGIWWLICSPFRFVKFVILLPFRLFKFYRKKYEYAE